MIGMAGCNTVGKNLEKDAAMGFFDNIEELKPRKPSERADALSHFIAGCVYERGGKTDQAIHEFVTAAKLTPDSPTLTLHLVRAYVRIQDYDNAQAMAEKAVKLIPDNANIRIVLGEIYHQRGQYDDAVAAFQKAIEIDPQNIMGYGALLTVEESTNDLVAAIDVYQRLAAMMPGAAQVQFQLGLTLARINDSEGAKAALERAVELNPDLVRARFLLGAIYLDTNNPQKAEEHLKAYLESTPDDVRARENLAGALARQDKFAQSLDQITILVSANNSEQRHEVARMLLLLKMGRFSEADKAIPASGAPILGSLLRSMARHGAGEPYAPIFMQLDSVDGDLDQESGEILNGLLYLFGNESTGQLFIDAIHHYRSEGYETRVGNLIEARILMSLERYEDAEQALKRTLEAFGTDKLTHYYLGIVYEELGRILEAECHIKAYLAEQPNDAEALNFLGYLYADHNVKLDEAEVLLKRALEIEPKNSYYLDSLGWVYYRKGNAKLAIEYIQKAIVESENDDSELRDHLGDAYLLQGDVGKALAEWNRAQRLNPKLDGVAEKIRAHQR